MHPLAESSNPTFFSARTYEINEVNVLMLLVLTVCRLLDKKYDIKQLLLSRRAGVETVLRVVGDTV
jgi:hypothetical protein